VTVGEAYLLDRRMFRRFTTGAVLDPDWLRVSFPPLTSTTSCADSSTSAARASGRTSGLRGRVAPEWRYSAFPCYFALNVEAIANVETCFAMATPALTEKR
jgi:hypothetical protein